MSRRWRPCGAAAGAPPRRRGGSALATAARLAAPSVVCQRLVHPARARRARRGGARQMAHTQAAQLEAHVALLRCPASPWGALCELGGLQTHAAKPTRDAEKDREEPRTHARTTHARARLYIRLPRTDIQFSCSRFTQGAHEIFSEAGWPTCTLWGRAAGLSSCPQPRSAAVAAASPPNTLSAKDIIGLERAARAERAVISYLRDITAHHVQRQT